MLDGVLNSYQMQGIAEHGTAQQSRAKQRNAQQRTAQQLTAKNLTALAHLDELDGVNPK